MPLLQIVVDTFWFFVPALAANSAPVLAARYQWVPSLAVPIDSGRLFAGQPLLGSTKTWRGVVVGLLFGSIAGVFQYWLQPYVAPAISLIAPYRSLVAALGWGTWLAVGALGGDLVKSFFKRRLGIAPSHSWKPFDQIDVAVGVWLIAAPFVAVSLSHVITSFVVVGTLMYATSALGVHFKIKSAT